MKANFCKTLFKSKNNKIEIDFEEIFNHVENCDDCKKEFEQLKKDIIKKMPVLGVIINQLI